MLSDLYAPANGAKAPLPPHNASVNYCDIFVQYYAAKKKYTQLFLRSYGDKFCWIFIHQLVNAPQKVV